ncbi:hypothetical protein ABPG74_017229 [Tetrahymena malaccensis]
MAELRDNNFVLELLKGFSIDKVDKEISQEICNQVEIELRSLIEDSIKFMKHFKRDKLTTSDVEYALKDRNYYDKIFGYDVSEKVSFKKHANYWIKQDEERDLQSYLEAQVKSLKRQVMQPTVTAWWMSIDGKIPPINENKFIKNKTAILKYDELKKEEYSKNFNIIKDKPRSLLSEEINKFFVEITKVIAETEEQIDNPKLNLPGAPFRETPKLKIILNNLKTNSGLTSLLPFLLNYLYQDYDLENKNGVSKKYITLKILHCIILNTGINIEFHLHIIIKILIHFITASVLSTNKCVDEIQFREQSAQNLSYLINRFTFKYITLKQNICDTLLGILKETLNQKVLNYQVLLGIIMTFSHFESNIIRQLILPTIMQIFMNEDFRKDLNCLASINLRSQHRNEYINLQNQKENNMEIEQQQKSNIIEETDKVKKQKIIKESIQKVIKNNNEAHSLLNELKLLVLKVFNEYSFATSKTEALLFQELEEQFITELNPLVIRLIYNNMPIQLKYLDERQYNPSYMNLML